MRIIAFIIEAQVVRQILTHLGEPTFPPRMAPARGPPLWEAVMEVLSSNDPLTQPEPAYEFDQRIATGTDQVTVRDANRDVLREIDD